MKRKSGVGKNTMRVKGVHLRYMEDYRQGTDYMVIFNFNKNK